MKEDNSGYRLADKIPANEPKKIKSKNKFIVLDPEITENFNKTAVITFGRFSPPTVGHEKLVNALINEAVKRKAAAMIFTSHSYDSKKNPIPYYDKLMFLTMAFGNIVKNTNAKDIIGVLKELSGQYTEIVVMVGSDRVKEFDTLLNKYNHKEYTFNNIEIVSAGERDPDSDKTDGISSSKMRQFAADNNFTEFKKNLPSKLHVQAKEVFDFVRKGMGLELTLVEKRHHYLFKKNGTVNFDKRFKLYKKKYDPELKEIFDIMESFNSVYPNTPQDREWGTDTLTRILKKSTPGQFNEDPSEEIINKPKIQSYLNKAFDANNMIRNLKGSTDSYTIKMLDGVVYMINQRNGDLVKVYNFPDFVSYLKRFGIQR